MTERDDDPTDYDIDQADLDELCDGDPHCTCPTCIEEFARLQERAQREHDEDDGLTYADPRDERDRRRWED